MPSMMMMSVPAPCVPMTTCEVLRVIMFQSDDGPIPTPEDICIHWPGEHGWSEEEIARDDIKLVWFSFNDLKCRWLPAPTCSTSPCSGGSTSWTPVDQQT